MIHTLRTTMRVTRPRTEVFEFFADAANLERITPRELSFRITTPGMIDMRAGARIDYELRLMGVPFKWETLISTWDPPFRFVDEQLRGPYKSWVHTHTFTEDPAGTLIEDEVRWSLPLYPLGQVAYPLVARQLKRIFSYREQAIRSFLS